MVLHFHSVKLAWVFAAFLNLFLVLYFTRENKGASNGTLKASPCPCVSNSSEADINNQLAGLPTSLVSLLTDNRFPALVYPMFIPDMRGFVRGLMYEF